MIVVLLLERRRYYVGYTKSVKQFFKKKHVIRWDRHCYPVRILAFLEGDRTDIDRIMLLLMQNVGWRNVESIKSWTPLIHKSGIELEYPKKGEFCIRCLRKGHARINCKETTYFSGHPLSKTCEICENSSHTIDMCPLAEIDYKLARYKEEKKTTSRERSRSKERSSRKNSSYSLSHTYTNKCEICRSAAHITGQCNATFDSNGEAIPHPFKPADLEQYPLTQFDENSSSDQQGD